MVLPEYSEVVDNDGNRYNKRGKSAGRLHREKVVDERKRFRPKTAPQRRAVPDAETPDSPKPVKFFIKRKKRRPLTKPGSAPARTRDRNEVLNAVSEANNPDRRRVASALPKIRPCRLDLPESSDSEQEESPRTAAAGLFLDIFNVDLDAMYGTCTSRKAEDPLLHDRQSDPHQRILTDMLEKIKAAQERKLRAEMGEESNVVIDEFDDDEEDDEEYFKHMEKRKQKAIKMWRLIRRKLEALQIERKGKQSNLGWMMVTNSMKVMTNAEKARQDLYDRYGFTSDLKKGQLPAINPMAHKQNTRLRSRFGLVSMGTTLSRSGTPATSTARNIQSRQSVG